MCFLHRSFIVRLRNDTKYVLLLFYKKWPQIANFDRIAHLQEDRQTIEKFTNQSNVIQNILRNNGL